MRGHFTFNVRLLARLLYAVMLSMFIIRTAHSQTAALNEAVMEIVLNNQDHSETLVVLRGGANDIWLEESDFAKLRLKTPKTSVYIYEERHYFPLAAIKDIHVEVDETRQRIAVQVPADAFMPSQFTAESRGTPVLTPAANGAFLNYQLSAQHVTDSTLSGAFTEMGIFTRAGVLTNSSVVRSQSATASQPRMTQWIRLDTAFTHDFPSRIERLTLGDSITNSGTWGSAVRMGGISWGKDFSLRPDLITTPLLTATGSAAVPSTVDVFINNQKVTSQELPPGPFIIDRLPAITGNGQISMVVRDALGREEVVTQSFYSSLSLLAPGLSQYQVNAGRVRNNYALSSNDYGDWVTEGTYRRGMTSWFTIEGHAESLEHFGHAVGLNAAFAMGNYGIVNLIGATSSGEGKSGSLAGAGIESNFSRFNFTLNTKIASRDYRQVANAGNGYLQFKQRDLAQVGINMSRVGSVAMAYVHDTYYDSPQLRNLNLTYNVLVSNRVSLSLVASRTMTGQNSNSFFLTFIMPMGTRAASLSANGGNGEGAPPNEVYASLVQNAPVGNGYGYQVSASTRGNYNADGRLQTSAGDLDAQVARQQGINGQSLYWSGAATLIGGQLDVTRTVYDSFALIDVDNIPNVPVYVDHQLVTHTDKHGYALLHYLLPYQNNRINVEPTELPLDTQIEARTLVIVPGYRSGVIAHFPVTHIRGATFRLIMDNGSPVPVGAQVRFNGKVFPVTYDGNTYVTGYDHGMSGHVSWSGGSCEFRVQPPANDSQTDPLPDLGDIKCRSANITSRPLQ